MFDPAPAEDVEREIRFHLEMRVSELEAGGLSEEEARREAERAFGDVERWRRESRAVTVRNRRARRRALAVDALIQDVRVGARGLAKRPLFLFVAVATLGLGVGANAAVFALMDRVLLRPLPYPESESLVSIWEVGERGGSIHVTTPNFLDWEAGARSFTALAAHSSSDFGGAWTILGGAEPVRREVAQVSAAFFEVLGVDPEIGRTFEGSEYTGAPHVAVVGRRFWQELLGGERDLTRLALNIEGFGLQVVGVMPAGFAYPGEAEVWIPLDLADGTSRSSHNHEAIGRLRPGVTVAQASAELDRLQARIRAEYGSEVDAVGARVTSLQEELYGSTRRPLEMLMGAALLVLLAACANLAGAWFARSLGRGGEMAVRASLGATRGRLVRQLVTEGALVGLAGAVAGLGVAVAALRASTSLRPATLAGAGVVGIDARLLAFAAALALVATLAFALHPALRLAHAGVGGALRLGTRGGGGRRGNRMASLLVGAEVAAAFVLLSGSVLLLRSFWRLMDRELGFQTRNVLTVSVSLPRARFPNDTAVSAFYDRLLPELAARPGVAALGLINHVPLGGASVNGGFEIEGRGEDAGTAAYRVVSEGYFDALSIPLLRGRRFGSADRIGTSTVALVNRSLAERYFPGEEVVGKRIRRLRNDAYYYSPEEWLTVVGVVGDVRHHGPLSEAGPEVYVYYRQRAFRADDAVLVAAVNGPAGAAGESMRAAIRERSPDIPVEIGSLDERRAATVSEQRFGMLVLGAFAGIAVLLAAIGIHGVVAQAVQHRKREMGIRFALGASPARVLAPTMRATIVAVTGGMLSGAILAGALDRVLRGLLFGVTEVDSRTLFAAAGLLLLASTAAALGPALRAVRADPLDSLRSD